MNETSDSRVPGRLICLLIYQWILVLVALFFIVRFVQLFIAYDYLFALYIIVLGCWASAMSFASLAIMRRSPQGLLVGMICHLALELPGSLGVLGFGILWLQSSWSDSGSWVWDPFFLIFALMWLPFVVISAWAFFYLRRLRKSVSSK